jgi:hypothetical protein
MTSYKSAHARVVGNATQSKTAGVGAGTSPPAQEHDVRTQLYTNGTLSCVAREVDQ